MTNRTAARTIALFAAATLIGVTGCASADAPPAPRSRSVHVAEHQTVELAPAVSLRYDSVVDSRCPQNVQCVVAGKVSHSFVLASKGGDEVFTLDREGAKFDSTSVPGMTIVLARDPVPASPGAPHSVVLDVAVK
jgi:hypothetical protein